MPQRTNPDSELNIKRIDSRKKSRNGGETHGFQVYFNRSNIEYTRFFADLINGGKESARLAARTFRETLSASIPPSRNGPCRSGPAKSNTGRMGISFTEEPLKSGKTTLYVQATARIENGVSKNRKFRVGSRHLDEVIQEAVSWRNEVLAERISRQAINHEDNTEA